MFEEKPILFPNPAEHPEWTNPQSQPFYSRLMEETGGYIYPWQSQFDEPTAEMILAQHICAYISNQSRVLDVGCGHGEFANQFAARAREVIGIDLIEGFIATANKNRKTNSRFLVVHADNKLPFPDDYFDAAYTKKGPTSWYREANRVVKPGGLVCGLYHRGTDGGLRSLFPGLYSPMERIDFDQASRSLQRNLQLTDSGLDEINIEFIEETEYLLTPEDVLRKKCFGQSKKLKEYVWSTCLKGVEQIFYKHATPKGLKITNYYYLVTCKANQK
ncbi:class I SAM-dependent methyltransferase [Paenibacillus sp. HJGM_3]|uniref:class I SAM-dependent methyltransferase n=1 Tax=Paenibacillus sp. HJGM_3 TaxID=3379816 RepID=UPI00385C8068